MQGSEKSISLVLGGRSQEAAALAWEKGTSGPEEKVYSEWLESVKENPAVVDYEVRLKSSEGTRGSTVHQPKVHATPFPFPLPF